MRLFILQPRQRADTQSLSQYSRSNTGSHLDTCTCTCWPWVTHNFYTFDFCPRVKYQGQKMFPLNFALHIFTSQRFMEEGIKVTVKADENIERASPTDRLWERRNWRRMNGGRVRKRRGELWAGVKWRKGVGWGRGRGGSGALHGEEGPSEWKPRHVGAPQNTHLVRVPPVTQVSGSLKSERR